MTFLILFFTVATILLCGLICASQLVARAHRRARWREMAERQKAMLEAGKIVDTETFS